MCLLTFLLEVMVFDSSFKEILKFLRQEKMWTATSPGISGSERRFHSSSLTLSLCSWWVKIKINLFIIYFVLSRKYIRDSDFRTISTDICFCLEITNGKSLLSKLSYYRVYFVTDDNSLFKR